MPHLALLLIQRLQQLLIQRQAPLLALLLIQRHAPHLALLLIQRQALLLIQRPAAAVAVVRAAAAVGQRHAVGQAAMDQREAPPSATEAW